MGPASVTKALYWFGERIQALDEIWEVVIVHRDGIVFDNIDSIIDWLHLAQWR
jgi:hypothetical protein